MVCVVPRSHCAAAAGLMTLEGGAGGPVGGDCGAVVRAGLAEINDPGVVGTECGSVAIEAKIGWPVSQATDDETRIGGGITGCVVAIDGSGADTVVEDIRVGIIGNARAPAIGVSIDGGDLGTALRFQPPSGIGSGGLAGIAPGVSGSHVVTQFVGENHLAGCHGGSGVDGVSVAPVCDAALPALPCGGDETHQIGPEPIAQVGDGIQHSVALVSQIGELIAQAGGTGSRSHVSGILDGAEQHHFGIGDLAVGESQGHAVHRGDDAGFDLGDPAIQRCVPPGS